MAPTRQSRRIALVGASGNIGSSTLRALLSHDIHDITVIARPESQATFSNKVAVRKGSFDDEAFLLSALKGIDILVLQLSIPASGIQEKFYEAAAKAGVPYILPIEFGNSLDAKGMYERFSFLPEKATLRQRIEDLGVSSWIAVVTNPWYDFCFGKGEWGIDIVKRQATLWDGGNYKTNTTTLRRAGEATAELLALPDDELIRYKNQMFIVTSFYVTQREIFDSVLRATGTKEEDWDLTYPDAETSEKAYEVRLAKAAADGTFDYEAFTRRFTLSNFTPGRGGDINDKVEDLGRFGLEKEDIDQVTRQVAEKLVK